MPGIAESAQGQVKAKGNTGFPHSAWHIPLVEAPSTDWLERPAARCCWLRTVDESFAMMLKCIDEAVVSVRLEMYIFTESEIGRTFLSALVRAGERGVRVKVLVDALGSVGLSDRFWDPLRKAGGEMRWFNPLRLHRLGIRDHRKLLVCDENIAFVGGYNIAPEYQGDGVTRGWHDLGIKLQGILAAELAKSFDALFAIANFRHKWFLRLRKSQSQRLISTRDGQIILTGPWRGNRHFLHASLLSDLQKAQSIQIICAYFLPTRSIRRALARAVRRGCRVQIILAGKSDVPMSRLASHRLYQSFFRAGVDIYEYQPQVLHSKLFVMHHAVYVGSSNLDHRSLFMNYELMVRLPQEELALQGREFFERTLSHSLRIDPETWKTSRSLWKKLKERWAFFVLARIDPYLTLRQIKHLR